MEIPDLEAVEDMSMQVAAAPAMRSVSVVDIAELESEDLFQLPAIAKDREIDLSLLTARLCPANELCYAVLQQVSVAQNQLEGVPVAFVHATTA